ncbi:MAG: LysR substrate-binding domain-containing protein [Candidatus Devosia symbiotica]|nr:LysR substrate-binding domain-containing protein [Candidatus Devosia symbiotica]
MNAFRQVEATGDIKIGMSNDYAQAFLTPVLKRFTHRYPQVEVEVEVEVLTADTRELGERADLNRFHSVIVSANSKLEDLDILRRDRLYWIGGADHHVHLEPRLPLALWSERCNWRTIGLAALAQTNRDYRIVHTTSNAPLLRSVVREGLAVTIGPKWYLGPSLILLDDMNRTWPPGEDRVGLKVLADEMTAPLEVFLNYLRSCFRNEGTLPMSRSSGRIPSLLAIGFKVLGQLERLGLIIGAER